MSGVILQKTAAVRNGNVAAVTPVNEAAVGSGDAAAVTLVNTAAVGVRNGFVSENTVPSGPILHNPSGDTNPGLQTESYCPRPRQGVDRSNDRNRYPPVGLPTWKTGI